MKKALITGITGQDGSYLAELLIKKGYEVHGLIRRTSLANTKRIDHLINKSLAKKNIFFLHDGDLTDSSNLIRLIKSIDPDEIYNLGAQSHVQVSFDVPEYTANVDGIGTLRILEAIRILNSKAKFYQASTSELFGMAQEIPQKETTPFFPRSPYAIAKLYAYWVVVNYREAYKIFACNGILFNHESPRRGKDFVTRKITRAVASILEGEQEVLTLGNLNAKRDWGYAEDFVEGMWLMLQQKTPDDFILATGRTATVRQFVELSFKAVGIEIVWEGENVNEKGINKATGKVLVNIDPRFLRPTEADVLVGDPSKAKRILNWEPKTTLEELVNMMIQHDLKAVRKLKK